MHNHYHDIVTNKNKEITMKNVIMLVVVLVFVGCSEAETKNKKNITNKVIINCKN